MWRGNSLTKRNRHIARLSHNEESGIEVKVLALGVIQPGLHVYVFRRAIVCSVLSTNRLTHCIPKENENKLTFCLIRLSRAY